VTPEVLRTAWTLAIKGLIVVQKPARRYDQENEPENSTPVRKLKVTVMPVVRERPLKMMERMLIIWITAPKPVTARSLSVKKTLRSNNARPTRMSARNGVQTKSMIPTGIQ